LWSDAFGIVSRPREAMYDLVQALQKHVKTAVLSNTELSAIPHFMAYRSECFDLKMFSCEEGIIKPERELYERCLQRLNVELQEAVFIDDRIENIDGAKDVGLQAIHYVDYQELIKQLEGLGVIYEQ
jgi:putative hydrolase of the HAD superfamily